MKKFVAVFAFVCAIALVAIAIADSFSIRNGISWGLTSDEVQAKEGKEPDSSRSNILDYNGQNVGGYEKTNISYSFDRRSKLLYRIQYYFERYSYEDGPTRSNYRQDYDHNLMIFTELFNTLCSKYGQPETHNDSRFTHLGSDPIKISMSLPMVKYDVDNYAEWLVPFDDSYTLITLYLGTEDNTLYKDYDVRMEYEQISLEDGQNYLSNKHQDF